MIFWDSSAFVRAFLAEEPGHGEVQSLLADVEDHAASTFLFPETAGALLRRSRTRGSRRGIDSIAVRGMLQKFELIDFDLNLSERAFEVVERFALKGADAVHLATAVDFAGKVGKRGFKFVTSDREQAKAARAMGLRLITPGI